MPMHLWRKYVWCVALAELTCGDLSNVLLAGLRADEAAFEAVASSREMCEGRKLNTADCEAAEPIAELPEVM